MEKTTINEIQKAYEKVSYKIDRIDGIVTTAAYVVAFFCGYMVIDLIIINLF